jgi:hypothetical protein
MPVVWTNYSLAITVWSLFSNVVSLKIYIVNRVESALTTASNLRFFARECCSVELIANGFM